MCGKNAMLISLAGFSDSGTSEGASIILRSKQTVQNFCQDNTNEHEREVHNIQ
jgi:hypothetical protein